MKRTTTYFIAGTFTGVALAVGCAFALHASDPQSFYESIPAPPAVGHKALSNASTTLVQAIERAERESEGRAYYANFDLSGDTPTITVMAYTEEDIHRVVLNAQTSEVTATETVAAYPGEPVEGEWTVTKSGLRYFDLVEGEGEQPDGSNSFVTVHYSGWTIDGRMFDSSVQRGAPAQFPLGQVIRGWTEGVGSMRVGGKRKLVIPGNLAYGPGGNPRAGIPPNATLVFDVELLNVEDWPRGQNQPQQPGR